jgi:hypothetical protein
VRAAALALALAALCVCAAAPARASARLQVGVQDDALFVRAPGSPLVPALPAADGYSAARAIGATALRVNLLWADVETAPGVYDWTLVDRVVDEARANGLQPQLTLSAPAPPWATADGRRGVRDPSPRGYARFVGAAVAHFRGRVRRYALWNEPNWPSWLQPQRRAAVLYRVLYRHGYEAAKAADPAAQVLIGELAPMGPPEAAIPPLRFLREMTCSDRRWRRVRRSRGCTRLAADGFAHHPYTLGWAPSFPGFRADDVTLGSIRRLSAALTRLARRRALATPRGRSLPLYLTEYGYHANSARIPERERARYAVEAFERAAADRRVRQIVWYQVIAPPPQPTRVWDTALLDGDGVPRPTFRAIADWARRARR